MRLLHVTLLALATTALACSSKAPAPEAPQPQPAGTPTAETSNPSDGDLLATCTQMFTQQRECAATFLPGLVALRVTHDIPEGIAARDAELGREALVETAREEYAVDSTDSAIAATCDQLLATIPPEQVDAMLPKTNECLATSSCEEFVPCILELQESRFLNQ